MSSMKEVLGKTKKLVLNFTNRCCVPIAANHMVSWPNRRSSSSMASINCLGCSSSGAFGEECDHLCQRHVWHKCAAILFGNRDAKQTTFRELFKFCIGQLSLAISLCYFLRELVRQPLAMSEDFYILPKNLPIPTDDGAYTHLSNL